MSKSFYLNIFRMVSWCGIILVTINICGCGYFEVYKKTSYVSQITTVIKKNQDEMDNYIQLTNNKGAFSDKELKEKFLEIKNKFTDNKKELDAISPPQDYTGEHGNFSKGFQNCIESVDASLAVLETTDEKVKAERIEEAKTKIEDSKKLIKDSINRISIDLR